MIYMDITGNILLQWWANYPAHTQKNLVQEPPYLNVHPCLHKQVLLIIKNCMWNPMSI